MVPHCSGGRFSGEVFFANAFFASCPLMKHERSTQRFLQFYHKKTSDCSHNNIPRNANRGPSGIACDPLQTQSPFLQNPGLSSNSTSTSTS
jgi:hypothetical protein